MSKPNPLDPPVLTFGEHKLEVRSTVGMVMRLKGLQFQCKKEPELIGAVEGQPLDEEHEIMMLLFCLVKGSMREQGLDLTPIELFELVPASQAEELTAAVAEVMDTLGEAQQGKKKAKARKKKI